ncbi:MAG: PIG-L deacetylase family protein [Thermoanaerobaculia bacterium]
MTAVRTLVLAPHFDDEVLGCGGLIRQLAAAGARVEVLFLSDGSGGVEEIADRASYAARRRGEAEEVVRLLGCAGLEVLGIRDGALATGRAAAAAAIRRCLLAGGGERPGLLLVPSPLEISDDHRAAFAALHDVLQGAGETGELAEVARELEVWLYEVNHPGYPDRLVDVSDCRATLERAMAIYASQEERHPYLRSGIGLRQFRTHTLGPEVELAEGYRRLAASHFAGCDLAALVAEVGGSVPELSQTLRLTYAEIERLNAQIREMEGTRAWRLHRWVERLRGARRASDRSDRSDQLEPSEPGGRRGRRAD